MAKNTGIWAAVLGIILAVLKLWSGYKKEQAAQHTPQKEAEDDKKKMENAIVNGDTPIINDMFNDLRKTGNAGSNPAEYPGDSGNSG
jgi:hypothetical protein